LKGAKMSKVIIEKVKEVILPYLEEENIILYDIEYVFEDNENILRIYIDNEEENMDLLTCVSISEGISKLLDLNDPLDVPYSLEVSSPGAERVLRNKEEVIKAIGKSLKFLGIGDMLNFCLIVEKTYNTIKNPIPEANDETNI
jgi:ribosome maturation factor RimP